MYLIIELETFNKHRIDSYKIKTGNFNFGCTVKYIQPDLRVNYCWIFETILQTDTKEETRNSYIE